MYHCPKKSIDPALQDQGRSNTNQDVNWSKYPMQINKINTNKVYRPSKIILYSIKKIPKH